MRLFILVFCLFIGMTAKAEHQINQRLFDYAKNAPSSISKDIDKLVDYLIKPAKNERQKAEVLAYWIVENIAYDVDAWLYNQLRQPSHEKALAYKKAVCSGYSNLYAEMCKRAGVVCFDVSGYAKGFGYRAQSKFEKTNHAWNVLKLGEQYVLMDLTWASGVVTSNYDYERKLNKKYLFALP